MHTSDVPVSQSKIARTGSNSQGVNVDVNNYNDDVDNNGHDNPLTASKNKTSSERTALNIATATTSAAKGAATTYPVQEDPETQSTSVCRLEESFKSKSPNGVFLLEEHQWITASNVSSGDKISVVNVSGCTPVFFWNEENIPSVFHIFSGREATDGLEAATKAGRAAKVVLVQIAADEDTKFSNMMAAALAKITSLSKKNVELLGGELYKESDLNLELLERFRFDVTAGIRSVERIIETVSSREPLDDSRF
ncbi:hypothetical protein GLAREA_08801 [Glarea lozoyensis ATCC 20868]|uniref:Uncharacterized protein n=1 Tax=Glarea lozoyensis (strain ATCC 20868 / MF5171) TaxID=1116229 RepID=S3EEG1_GLAL2|nr:uncharacterized protein GLAREA_08801 [Glarea lozoyensis ATCC 20868]EPE36638.1 hypothetical protein GLAREA_08801 [Glarea lozoyensis ATCC 20868]